MRLYRSEFIIPPEVAAENEIKFRRIFDVYLSYGTISEAEVDAFFRVLSHNEIKDGRQEIIVSLLKNGEPSVFELIMSARSVSGPRYNVYYAKLQSYLRKIASESIVDQNVKGKVIAALRKLDK
jgi:hypothetical protein